jgi:hypothetical protein
MLTALLVMALTPATLLAQKDSGRVVIGRVCVTVYHATNGDPAVAGGQAAAVGKDMEERFRNEERLRFRHYRVLGTDTQPLFRSYENWAKPLKQSDEVLVRFEARGASTKDSMRMDLELWLGRKKILKTDALLQGDRPLHILGPEWRGGRLIISVARAHKTNP